MMVGLLGQGKRIINVDESWVNQTHYNRRIWAPTNSPATATTRMITPRLSFIAALDTDGRVYYSLLHANTDSDIMIMFLSHLFAALDTETPGWRSNSIVLLDGAKYHTSEQCASYLRVSQAPVIFSGPYSYGKSTSFCTVELLFLTFVLFCSCCSDRAALWKLQDG